MTPPLRRSSRRATKKARSDSATKKKKKPKKASAKKKKSQKTRPKKGKSGKATTKKSAGGSTKKTRKRTRSSKPKQKVGTDALQRSLATAESPGKSERDPKTDGSEDRKRTFDELASSGTQTLESKRTRTGSVSDQDRRVSDASLDGYDSLSSPSLKATGKHESEASIATQNDPPRGRNAMSLASAIPSSSITNRSPSVERDKKPNKQTTNQETPRSPEPARTGFEESFGSPRTLRKPSKRRGEALTPTNRSATNSPTPKCESTKLVASQPIKTEIKSLPYDSDDSSTSCDAPAMKTEHHSISPRMSPMTGSDCKFNRKFHHERHKVAAAVLKQSAPVQPIFSPPSNVSKPIKPTKPKRLKFDIRRFSPHIPPREQPSAPRDPRRLPNSAVHSKPPQATAPRRRTQRWRGEPRQHTNRHRNAGEPSHYPRRLTPPEPPPPPPRDGRSGHISHHGSNKLHAHQHDQRDRFSATPLLHELRSLQPSSHKQVTPAHTNYITPASTKQLVSVLSHISLALQPQKHAPPRVMAPQSSVIFETKPNVLTPVDNPTARHDASVKSTSSESRKRDRDHKYHSNPRKRSKRSGGRSIDSHLRKKYTTIFLDDVKIGDSCYGTFESKFNIKKIYDSGKLDVELTSKDMQIDVKDILSLCPTTSAPEERAGLSVFPKSEISSAEMRPEALTTSEQSASAEENPGHEHSPQKSADLPGEPLSRTHDLNLESLKSQEQQLLHETSTLKPAGSEKNIKAEKLEETVNMGVYDELDTQSLRIKLAKSEAERIEYTARSTRFGKRIIKYREELKALKAGNIALRANATTIYDTARVKIDRVNQRRNTLLKENTEKDRTIISLKICIAERDRQINALRNQNRELHHRATNKAESLGSQRERSVGDRSRERERDRSRSSDRGKERSAPGHESRTSKQKSEDQVKDRKWGLPVLHTPAGKTKPPPKKKPITDFPMPQ